MLAVGARLARVLVRGIFVSCVPRREIGISGATGFKNREARPEVFRYLLMLTLIYPPSTSPRSLGQLPP
jgi:hypothetical protein